ncbi:MAG: 1-deoxy-D-xylulose-5-phosphate reductoisomerase [Kineosporiaceae bacterium]
MPDVRCVTVLGSTGSVGTQALDVIGRNRDAFAVMGLAAGGRDPGAVAEQVITYDVPVVAVPSPEAGQVVTDLVRAAGRRVEVLTGPDAAAELAACDTDTVLNGISGAAGLRPTLAALTAGHRLALANKESLVVGGPLVTALVPPHEREDRILPVDSEHSALAQCLRGGRREEVRRLVLTASGGPFRGRPAAELRDVTPEQALAHPTWRMGPLVTTNSATLVNKGLEVIEAHLLFDVAYDRIDVVVHPQSVVHSMVEFVDGSTLAQCSPPDMRLPLALALGWPGRVPGAAPGCDWTTAATWTFEPLDDAAFPAVRLARDVGRAGGVMPAVFNAANEVAVEAFLGGRLRFPDIVAVVERVVTAAADAQLPAPDGVDDVLAADAWARERAGVTMGSPSAALARG